jgi:hypothetical protein
MKGSTVTSSCWVNCHYKRLLTFSLGGVSPLQQTACPWESSDGSTALSHGSDFCTPPPPKKGGCREHADSISPENTVKKNWVKGLNSSQSPSHTAYTLYGSNLVLLLDDQGSIFIRDRGIFLLLLCPLNLWGSCVFLFTWYQELSQGKSARTWKRF